MNVVKARRECLRVCHALQICCYVWQIREEKGFQNPKLVTTKKLVLELNITIVSSVGAEDNFPNIECLSPFFNVYTILHAALTPQHAHVSVLQYVLIL